VEYITQYFGNVKVMNISVMNMYIEIVTDLLRQRLCKCGNYATVEERGCLPRHECRLTTIATHRQGGHILRCQTTAINTWMTQE
jgi:hypothetical protein